MPPIYCDLTTFVLHLTFNSISRGTLIYLRTSLSLSSSGIMLQCLWEWWMQIPAPFNMDKDCSIPKDGERLLGNLWFIAR